MAEAIRWEGWDKMEAKLDKLAASYPDAVTRCAAATGLAVLEDAKRESPTVPKKTGTLFASGTYEVFGGAHWRQCKLMVGFNTTYAARVHQLPWYGVHWTTPGSGSYFLSSKILRHRREYITSWARSVSRSLGMT